MNRRGVRLRANARALLNMRHRPPVIPMNTNPEALALRTPEVEATLDALAALRSEALEVIEARVQILRTLRKEAIRVTSPEDWVLFKAREEDGGQVIAYLQDCGADRVRDLYGIEIFDISTPEKIAGTDPAVFHYLIRGSGRCKLTKQTLESVEGGRSSTDDVCRGKSGAELELLVRKSARANLDGNITRELAGMKSVPIGDLIDAWAGTTKVVDHCRKGRGFGSRDERIGGTADNTPDIPPPTCDVCGTKAVYRPARGTRKAFYGCPKYTQHADQKWIVDAAKWDATVRAEAAATTPDAAPPAEK